MIKNKEMVTLGPPYFRNETVTSRKDINFGLYVGAVGDYICHSVALKWIMDTQPHVRGTIYSPDYFLEIPKRIFHGKNGWRVFDRNELTQDVIKKNPTYIPSHESVLNGTGAHLVDLGFIYFANLHHAPDNCYYPDLDLDSIKIDTKVLSQHVRLPERYAVLTPGATDLNRQMPPSLFNKIQDHLITQDITPVYLGKAFMTKCHTTKFHEGYDLSKGINLIEKTSLLQAAKVLDGAVLTVGLDNGLLHLAACTKVPIIFGYNVIGPMYRRPRRPPHLVTIDIYPDKVELPCTFCMSDMRYFFGHDFKHCIYKDEKCLSWFDEHPELWIEAVDKVLSL